MRLSNWFSRGARRPEASRKSERKPTVRLGVESLEERAVPAIAGTVEDSKTVLSFAANQRIVDSALQRDGKVVVLSTFGTQGQTDFAITRLLTDGSLDTTFGVGGTSTRNLGATTNNQLSNDLATSIAVDKNGLIYVAGATTFPLTGDGEDVFLARFNQTGQIDTTFGNGNGFVLTTGIGEVGEGATDVFIQNDNKILVAGNAIQTRTVTSNGETRVNDMFVARYNVDGSLDPTLSADGIFRRTDAPNTVTNQEARRVIALSDRSIVVAGFAGATALAGTLTMFRLNGANGNLDGSFGTAGVASLNVANGRGDFVSQTFPIAEVGSTRQIIVGGSLQGNTEVGDFAAIRVTAAGAADLTFGNVGIANNDINENSADEATSMDLQRDGRIVLGGISNNGFGNIYGMARFNPDGSIDDSFSGDGVTILAAGQTPVGLHVLNSFSFLEPTDPRYTTVPFAFNRDLIITGLNAQGIFTARVTGVTDPKAVDNFRSVVEDTVTVINVTGNDVPARAGDTLVVESIGAKPPSNSVVTLTTKSAKGGIISKINATSVRYTPPAGFFGQDEFYYRLGDGLGGSSIAKVTLNVTPVNDAPVHALPKIFNIPRNQTSGFFDPTTVRIFDDAGDNVVFVSFAVNQGVLGITDRRGLNVVRGIDTAKIELYGKLADLNRSFDTLYYKPIRGFVGSVQMTVFSNDRGFFGPGGVKTTTSVTTINVFDRRPLISVANPAQLIYSTPRGITLNVSAANGVARFFRDNDGDALTFSLTVPTAQGTILVRSNGSFVFTPPATFRGTLSFTVQAFDGILFSDPLRITINVV